MMNVAQCLDDPNLFGEWFSGPTWSTWRAVLKAAFCIPMDAEERKLFHAVAEPAQACHGRRRGKAQARSTRRVFTKTRKCLEKSPWRYASTERGCRGWPKGDGPCTDARPHGPWRGPPTGRCMVKPLLSGRSRTLPNAHSFSGAGVIEQKVGAK